MICAFCIVNWYLRNNGNTKNAMKIFYNIVEMGNLVVLCETVGKMYFCGNLSVRRNLAGLFGKWKSKFPSF